MTKRGWRTTHKVRIWSAWIGFLVIGTGVVLLGLSLAFLILRPLGKWFWFIDLGTHFLPQQVILVALCSLYLIFLRSKKAAIAAAFLALGLVSLAYFKSRMLAPDPLQFQSEDDPSLKPIETPLQVISFNVLTRNTSKERVLAWLESQVASSGDTLIFLMEVNDDWIHALEPLKKKLPYSIEVPRPDNFGVALYSSVPLTEIREVEFDEYEIPALVGPIKLGDRVVSIFGVHNLPPVQGERFNQRNLYLDNLNKAVLASPRPALVMGDLNCSPWSPNISRVLRTDPSNKELFDPFPYLIRPHSWSALEIISTSIDYILAHLELRPKSATLGPDLGSDHRPVMVRYGL